MKKILLASTMLVGTAGFAAADVSFTGSAYVGASYTFNNAGVGAKGASLDYALSFRAGMMSTTDYGLEVGAYAIIVTPSYNVVKDPDDADFGRRSFFTTSNGAGANAAPLATALVPASGIYMSGSWGRVDVMYRGDGDGTDNGGDWDIYTKYSNTWGNFGLEVYGIFVPGGNNAGASTSTKGGDFGAKGTYSFGDYSVWVGYDYDRNDGGAVSHNVSAGASATFGGFTGNAMVKYDVTNQGALDWHVDVAYATGPYAVSAFINDGLNYGVEGKYSLGGGVDIKAGYAGVQGGNSLVYAGVSMAF